MLEEIRELAREQRISAVLLSEHSDQFSADGYSAMQAECRRLNEQGDGPLLIPGIEVTANTKAHILCFGLSTWIQPLRPEAEIIEDARAQGAFVVLAHPSNRALEMAARSGMAFDGIEIWNVKRSRFQGNWHHCDVLNSSRASFLGWRGLIGLDAHEGGDFRAAWIEVETTELSAKAILTCLRQGSFTNVARGIRISSEGRYSLPVRDHVLIPVRNTLWKGLALVGRPIRAFSPDIVRSVRNKVKRYV